MPSRRRSKSPKRKLYITKSGKSRCAKGSHRRVRRSGSKGSKCVRTRKSGRKSRKSGRKSRKSGRKSRKSSPGRKSRKSRRSSSKSKKRGFHMLSHGSVKRFSAFGLPDGASVGPQVDLDFKRPRMNVQDELLLQDYLAQRDLQKIANAQAQVTPSVAAKVDKILEKKAESNKKAQKLIDDIEKCMKTDGKIFNMGTLRCKNIAPREPKACSGDRPDRNPKSGRCYSKAKYDARMAKLGARKSRKSHRKSKSRKACKSGQRRSRKTGRCRVSPKRKPCKSGQRRSRKTNRCRKSKK